MDTPRRGGGSGIALRCGISVLARTVVTSVYSAASNRCRSAASSRNEPTPAPVLLSRQPTFTPDGGSAFAAAQTAAIRTRPRSTWSKSGTRSCAEKVENVAFSTR